MTREALRQRALRLLAQRDHSRAELVRKLASLGTPEEIEAVLDRMTELDLQSDRRFAEQLVRSKASRFGAARLRHELRQRGIADELGDAALASELPDGEFARARTVWQGRFGHLPADARDWARQARFLQYRGFSADVIRQILKGTDHEPA
ncbi:MAG: recombination regulator RecX [Rhodocyclaceae bacterium]|nr:recombination regulator RecX [Rhodocyclaceae bacterium]